MDLKKVLVVAACALLVPCVAFVNAQDGGKLTLEVGNAITMGGFTVQDVTIDIATEVFNPRLAAEYQFGEDGLSVGLDYAMSKNTFTGEWSSDSESGDGDIDVERTEFCLYVRFGNRDCTNIRLGYRNFNYEFSNGALSQYQNGRLTEMDLNANAKGDLTTGLDAELNLIFGEGVKFGVGIGYSYFLDAKYDWSYDQVIGGRTIPVSGSASLEAHSVRIRPEVSFALNDATRLYLNYTVQASIWSGDFEGETENYPALDVYSAVGVGVTYTMGM